MTTRTQQRQDDILDSAPLKRGEWGKGRLAQVYYVGSHVCLTDVAICAQKSTKSFTQTNHKPFSAQLHRLLMSSNKWRMRQFGLKRASSWSKEVKMDTWYVKHGVGNKIIIQGDLIRARRWRLAPTSMLLKLSLSCQVLLLTKIWQMSLSIVFTQCFRE